MRNYLVGLLLLVSASSFGGAKGDGSMEEGVQRVNRLSLRELFPNFPGDTDGEVRKKLTEFFRKEQKKFNARAQERHK